MNEKITIIIPFSNKDKQIIGSCFTPIIRQLTSEDQLIILNYTNDKWLDKEFFPKKDNVLVFKKKSNEFKLINDAIKNVAIHDKIFLIDPSLIIRPNYIKNLKRTYVNGLLIGKVKYKSKFIEERSLFNIFFSRKDFINLKGFYKEFDSGSYTPLILLEELYKHNGLNVRVNKDLIVKSNESPNIRKLKNQNLLETKVSQIKKDLYKNEDNESLISIHDSKKVHKSTKKEVKSKKVKEPEKLKKIDINKAYENFQIIDKKPRILFICDVKGWAWDIKSHILKKYLSNEFVIDIDYFFNGDRKYKKNNYDLYFTYGHSFIDKIENVPFYKKITGVTAHRERRIIEPQMKKAAYIHANSILLYNEVVQFHENVFYIPNGVDEQQFYIKKEIPLVRQNLNAGHVGKLSPRKGQNEILKPAVRRAKVNEVFHLNNYKTRIKHDKMVDIYQNMDVMLIASIEDGTPASLLEGAACGRASISNKIGNAPEFIQDGVNGFLVDRNIESYVEKLKWCKEHRQELIEMGKKAREEIEKNWTWKKQAENYRAMFKKILYGIDE